MWCGMWGHHLWWGPVCVCVWWVGGWVVGWGGGGSTVITASANVLQTLIGNWRHQYVTTDTENKAKFAHPHTTRRTSNTSMSSTRCLIWATRYLILSIGLQLKPECNINITAKLSCVLFLEHYSRHCQLYAILKYPNSTMPVYCFRLTAVIVKSPSYCPF